MAATTECNIGHPSKGIKQPLSDQISVILNKFVQWLEYFGEISQDQYDFWATPWGQWGRSLYYRKPLLGTAVVAPFVFLDAFLPVSRKWFWDRQRFPIADAHFAMGFAYLFQATGEDNYYRKAIYFLEVLKNTRCPGYEHYGWGYPFDWMTNSGRIMKFTPLITSTPYIYEAFSAIYNIDNDNKWLETMRSVAKHVAYDYCDEKIREDLYACSYIPRDQIPDRRFRHVVNANAYRAFIMADAAQRFAIDEYREIAERNLNFVLDMQESDGSWFYAADRTDRFIDHFHTCFVLKNLIKIENLTGHKKCRNAIKRGIKFYISHLLDEKGLPKPFAKTKRVTLYRRELYDYAESINLILLYLEHCSQFEKILNSQLSDLIFRWQKPDGSFRTRQLLFGWNNVPYHRWGQAQLFRSLSLWILREKQNQENKPSS